MGIYRMQLDMNFAETSQKEWLTRLLVWLFTLVTSTSGFFLTVFLREDLGFSGYQIGQIYAVQAITGLAVAFPAGLLNDRFSSRVIIVIALFVQSIGYLLMTQVHLFWLFITVFFFWTLANSLFKMSLDVQVFKTDTGEKTASRMSLYQTWKFMGLTIGTILAGYALAIFDFRLTLILTAFVLVLIGGLSLKLPKTKLAKSKLSDYRADFSDPKILLLAFWLFLFTTHWGAEATCYSLFLRTDFGLDYGEMGLYMAAEFAVLTLAIYCLGAKADKPGILFKAVIAGLLASGVGQIGMIFDPVWLSVSFRMLHGLGDGLMFLAIYVGVAKLFTNERIGGNAGLVNLAMMLGFVVGALIYSPMGEKYGYGTSLWISGLTTALLVIPLLFMRHTKIKVQ